MNADRRETLSRIAREPKLRAYVVERVLRGGFMTTIDEPDPYLRGVLEGQRNAALIELRDFLEVGEQEFLLVFMDVMKGQTWQTKKPQPEP